MGKIYRNETGACVSFSSRIKVHSVAPPVKYKKGGLQINHPIKKSRPIESSIKNFCRKKHGGPIISLDCENTSAGPGFNIQRKRAHDGPWNHLREELEAAHVEEQLLKPTLQGTVRPWNKKKWNIKLEGRTNCSNKKDREITASLRKNKFRQKILYIPDMHCKISKTYLY
jgi:hypothetical protein